MAHGASSDHGTGGGRPPGPPRHTASLQGLTFAGEALDRCAEERSDPELIARLLQDPATGVVSIRDGRLAVIADGHEGRARLLVRPPQTGDRPDRAVFLGRRAGPIGSPLDAVGPFGRGRAGSPGSAADAGGDPRGGTGGDGERTASVGGERTAYVGVAAPTDDEAPDETETGPLRWRGLRSIAVALPPVEASLAATLSALANWHATHTHCARCGAPTVPVQAGWVRRCTIEGSEHFPRTDPAVIMAVVDDDDRLLLARGAGFSPTGMSVLAGFVEPGESLAAAVVREVAEEVGLEVGEVDYLGDQPWPFPTGLMIGFRARALTTELRLQDGEIETARWWTREEFARALADESLHISGRLSIARRLIEHWWGAPLDVPDRTLRR